MAKISGALMSLSASGTIAKTLTYGNWKGINYARTRVIPANPRTIAQTLTRSVFRFIGDLYKFMPGIAREPWIAAVSGQPMTAQNMIASKNIPALRGDVDLTDIILSPGALGGIPPTGITATAGAGQITVAVAAPSGPSGWTLVSAQAVAVRDQAPDVNLVSSPVAGEDLTDPYSIVLTGLVPGELYHVGAWLKWLTAGGNTAYSISLTATATPT